jgi:hypothetical protein
MDWMLLAVAGRSVPGPLDPATALFSFVTALAFSAGVGWWAQRLARARALRQLSELAEATPVGGLH